MSEYTLKELEDCNEYYINTNLILLENKIPKEWLGSIEESYIVGKEFIIPGQLPTIEEICKLRNINLYELGSSEENVNKIIGIDLDDTFYPTPEQVIKKEDPHKCRCDFYKQVLPYGCNCKGI